MPLYTSELFDPYLKLVRDPKNRDSKTKLPKITKIKSILHFDDEQTAVMVLELRKIYTNYKDNPTTNPSNDPLVSTRTLCKLGLIPPRVENALINDMNLSLYDDLLSLPSEVLKYIETKDWNNRTIPNFGDKSRREMAVLYDKFGWENESLKRWRGVSATAVVSQKDFWTAAGVMCKHYKKPKELIARMTPEYASAPMEERTELAKFLLNPGCLDRPAVYKYLRLKASDLVE